MSRGVWERLPLSETFFTSIGLNLLNFEFSSIILNRASSDLTSGFFEEAHLTIIELTCLITFIYFVLVVILNEPPPNTGGYLLDCC
jgi:hypothetical protein